MRYEVPQFIDIEDKIVGPLSWKQFVYVAGAVGASVLLWISPLPKILAIIIGSPIVLLALALAFYKVNQRPFILFLESFFNYHVKSKLYIWKKRERPIEEPTKTLEQEAEEMLGMRQTYIPRMSDSKLKELTWALDIEEREQGEVL